MLITLGFPGALVIKNPPAIAWDQGSILGSGRSPEEGMATHSSILACRIPWTEGPGGLQSMGSQRGGHDWGTRRTLTHGASSGMTGSLAHSCYPSPQPPPKLWWMLSESRFSIQGTLTLFLWNLAAEKGSDGEINSWSPDSKDGGGHHKPLRRQKSILCWCREIKFSLHRTILYKKQVFSHLHVIGRFSFPSVPLIDNTVQPAFQTECFQIMKLLVN